MSVESRILQMPIAPNIPTLQVEPQLLLGKFQTQNLINIMGLMEQIINIFNTNKVSVQFLTKKNVKKLALPKLVE